MAEDAQLTRARGGPVGPRAATRKESERPGSKLRADEIIEFGPSTAVIGAYWIDERGQKGEPLLFQVATMRDGKITDLATTVGAKRL